MSEASGRATTRPSFSSVPTAASIEAIDTGRPAASGIPRYGKRTAFFSGNSGRINESLLTLFFLIEDDEEHPLDKLRPHRALIGPARKADGSLESRVRDLHRVVKVAFLHEPVSAHAADSELRARRFHPHLVGAHPPQAELHQPARGG